MSWIISQENLRIVDQNTVSASTLSLGSIRSWGVQNNDRKYALMENTLANVRIFDRKRNIELNRKTLQLLFYTKEAVHDNLNPFLGLCFSGKMNELQILWKHCIRGSLQDMIHNDELTFDHNFQSAFTRDIVKGLEYLHTSSIGYHGSLNSSRCLVDGHWTIKLTDFGLEWMLYHWIEEKHIAVPNEIELIASSEKQVMAPEIVLLMDGSNIGNPFKLTIEEHRMADMYSFGMLMYEILFRKQPYNDVDIGWLSKFDTPQIPNVPKIHTQLAHLMNQCWSSRPDERPNIKTAKMITESALKTSGSLVDQMIRIMQLYTNNLERLVKDRTEMLEETRVQADKLLEQLLPPMVASELKLGRAVPPQSFRLATVMFSDIVDFTTLCSQSSPLEIVAFLNGMFSGFDDIISRYDAYKVETIGDAYMVVSGVPRKNGLDHVREICEIALEQKHFLSQFKIPHKPEQILLCRWGFHTGPVAAGVIGQVAPRYSLFGDTVNVASRMESLGKANRIQMSSFSKDVIERHFLEFHVSLRGEIDIKGKGKMLTYWLEGKL